MEPGRQKNNPIPIEGAYNNPQLPNKPMSIGPTINSRYNQPNMPSSLINQPTLSLSSGSPSFNPPSSNSQPVRERFDCNQRIVKIISSNNLDKDIAMRSGASIVFQGNKILVSGANESVVGQAVEELKNLINQYTFDENATWKYLENDGQYIEYGDSIKRLIEQDYQTSYPKLVSPDYENYSLSTEFSTAGGSYILEFAKIGGVHRQRRKNVDDDTIRAVKRQGAGEDLNKDFVRNYTWQWRDDYGEFRDYEPDAIFLIEQSFIECSSGKRKTAVVLIQGCNGKTYKLDFNLKTQINEVTSFPRTIQRVDLA